MNKGETIKGRFKEQLLVTDATTDLGNWLNGQLVLYLGDLANPRIGLNLTENPVPPER